MNDSDKEGEEDGEEAQSKVVDKSQNSLSSLEEALPSTSLLLTLFPWKIH